ncbi:MAG: hypothetical protein IKK58_04115 [Clostridia bacterium]|nr:hypothetical protein [Clostridia bacterium]
MKPTYKIITVIALVAVMLCGCMAPQTTITPENSATQNVTDTPAPDYVTSIPTDTPPPDCISTGPTLGVTPTAPADSATPDTVTTAPGGTSGCVITVSPTAEPTPTPTGTATSGVVVGPTVTHQEVSEWDYFFTYGDASIKGTALTRFNEGGATGITSGGVYGKAIVTSNGLLLKAGSSTCFDSYNAYSGANLKTANFSKAKYLGITVTNNDNKEVLFAPQGTDGDGKTLWLYPTGDAIALAPADGGKVYAADGAGNVSGRYAIKIPANFSGNILIPVNRLCDNNDSSVANKWTAIRPIEKLGFHYANAAESDNGLLVSAVFICDTALQAPDKIASGIMNENYSYTDTQRITPFWESNTMYNESMTMIKRADGSIYGKLLFVPTKINAIVNVYLNKEYKEGVDWEWEKGTNKIKWLNGSSIPYFTDADLSGSGAPNYGTWDELGRCKIGNCLYCVSAFLFEKQICVSYTYDINQVESQNIKYTEYQGDKLPKTLEKLNSNKDLNVLFYGDSIFSGCDASGMYGREPFMPYMHKLIEARLQKETKGKVTVDNIAVGGWTVQNGIDALTGNVNGTSYKDKIQSKSYDLLILSFGMNDINAGEESKELFLNCTKQIVDTIKAKNPNLEVILVSCMNPNPRVGWDVNQKHNGAWLKEMAAESKYSSYTAVVDFYAVHKSILAYKDFSATTGNNINHPNDWLIRVYAQNILATMIK